MKLKASHPYLWHYVAAAIDESCAPGMTYLENIECEDDVLASLAECELVASGMDYEQIYEYAYDGAFEPLPSAAAELYCGMYVF